MMTGQEFRKKKEKKCNDELEFVDFKEFWVVKVIEEGVCGGKFPCIRVS